MGFSIGACLPILIPLVIKSTQSLRHFCFLMVCCVVLSYRVVLNTGMFPKLESVKWKGEGSFLLTWLPLQSVRTPYIVEFGQIHPLHFIYFFILPMTFYNINLDVASLEKGWIQPAVKTGIKVYPHYYLSCSCFMTLPFSFRQWKVVPF